MKNRAVETSSSGIPPGEIGETLDTSDESHKRAYKLLVLRREIKYAKTVLSKKQAALKSALAQQRRLEEGSNAQAKVLEDAVVTISQDRSPTHKPSESPAFTSTSRSKYSPFTSKYSSSMLTTKYSSSTSKPSCASQAITSKDGRVNLKPTITYGGNIYDTRKVKAEFSDYRY